MPSTRLPRQPQASSSAPPPVAGGTSGTAAVNFTPAVVEAFYQQVPLFVLTADRPPEWIDQQDNQAIHQPGMYAPHVRYAGVLPLDDGHEDARWHTVRLIGEALDAAQGLQPGPVHINAPLREPLYPPPGYQHDFSRPALVAITPPTRPTLLESAWPPLRRGRCWSSNPRSCHASA